MRLLHVRTFKLESFDDPKTRPRYVILSHRWREDEVLFGDVWDKAYSGAILALAEQIESLKIKLEGSDRKAEGNLWDFQLLRAQQKKGWSKIKNCCAETANCGIDYVWIDTCCINKDSSTELSEAINSMFNWYKDAQMCFAYLDDVNVHESSRQLLEDSEWFKRGWTLQELIAPREVFFYQQDWNFLGFRSSMATNLSGITGIAPDILCRGTAETQNDKINSPRHELREIDHFSVAAKFSWASRRTTSRGEDRSYSLLGLFGLSMPILYGEGEEAAFYRLQIEVFRATGDHTMFAWSSGMIPGAGFIDLQPFHNNIGRRASSGSLSYISRPEVYSDAEVLGNILSPSVNTFCHSELEKEPYDEAFLANLCSSKIKSQFLEYSSFGHGLRVQLVLEPVAGIPGRLGCFLAHLACKHAPTENRIGIYLKRGSAGTYHRMGPNTLLGIGPSETFHADYRLENVYINSLNMFRMFPAPYARPRTLYLRIEGLENSGYSMKYGFSALGIEKYCQISQTVTAVKVGPSQWMITRPFDKIYSFAGLFQKTRPPQQPTNRSFILVIEIEAIVIRSLIKDAGFNHCMFPGPHEPTESDVECELAHLSEFIGGLRGEMIHWHFGPTMLLRHDLPWGDIILINASFNHEPATRSELSLFMKEQLPVTFQSQRQLPPNLK